MVIVSDSNGNLYQLLVNAADGSLEVLPAPNGSVPSNTTVSNAVSFKAYDLIKSSMRLIGMVASGEQPTMAEASDGLMVLNQMIDAWNAESLGIFTTRTDDFAFVANKQSYTLGPGGDFDMNRPAHIDGMSIIINANQSAPQELPISMLSIEDWQNRLPIKNVSQNFPLTCYDTGDFPLRTLNFWPVPTQSNNSVRIYSWQALTAPATLQTLISYPQGYAQAMRYNLAVLFAAEFDEEVSPIVLQVAQSSLARIKTMNAPDLSMTSDISPVDGGYNVRADMFGIP